MTKLKKWRGLFKKFIVVRTDGTSAPGKKHEACEYFVLDMNHDPFAAPALRAYADACEKRFPILARELKAKADWIDAQQ